MLGFVVAPSFTGSQTGSGTQRSAFDSWPHIWTARNQFVQKERFHLKFPLGKKLFSKTCLFASKRETLDYDDVPLLRDYRYPLLGFKGCYIVFSPSSIAQLTYFPIEGQAFFTCQCCFPILGKHWKWLAISSHLAVVKPAQNYTLHMHFLATREHHKTISKRRKVLKVTSFQLKNPMVGEICWDSGRTF